MNQSLVTLLWAYAAILVLGGVMGFVMAKSKVSLVVSAVSAAVLAAVALGKLPLVVAQAEAGGLVVVFISRFVRTRKPMPAIPMIVISAAVLALTFVLGKA